MAHHSPGHIAHTHTHARTNILGCDAEAGEVDGEKGGKKENLFICFFFLLWHYDQIYILEFIFGITK